eukprot:c19884_g1_i1.p1 GENE.c19884_g1_i1~~c19884_g1_i1.p1  ORF type:complete len:407 (-),score=106.27 c19884_g1_i1:259-1479(-)
MGPVRIKNQDPLSIKSFCMIHSKSISKTYYRKQFQKLGRKKSNLETANAKTTPKNSIILGNSYLYRFSQSEIGFVIKAGLVYRVRIKDQQIKYDVATALFSHGYNALFLGSRKSEWVKEERVMDELWTKKLMIGEMKDLESRKGEYISTWDRVNKTRHGGNHGAPLRALNSYFQKYPNREIYLGQDLDSNTERPTPLRQKKCSPKLNQNQVAQKMAQKGLHSKVRLSTLNSKSKLIIPTEKISDNSQKNKSFDIFKENSTQSSSKITQTKEKRRVSNKKLESSKNSSPKGQLAEITNQSPLILVSPKYPTVEDPIRLNACMGLIQNYSTKEETETNNSKIPEVEEEEQSKNLKIRKIINMKSNNQNPFWIHSAVKKKSNLTTDETNIRKSMSGNFSSIDLISKSLI